MVNLIPPDLIFVTGTTGRTCRFFLALEVTMRICANRYSFKHLCQLDIHLCYVLIDNDISTLSLIDADAG